MRTPDNALRESLLIFLICAGTIFPPGRARAASRPAGHPLLLVVNKGDHTIGLIDTVTARQIAVIPAGGDKPHEAAVSPDGRRAFVPIYGNSGVGKPGTNGRRIAVIDLAARRVISNVDFPHGVRPHCAVYDRRRSVLYITTEIDHSIAVLDPATLRIAGSIPTGQAESHMMVLSHDGRRAYTANVGPGTVSVIDIDARKVRAIIPISRRTQRISISPDDRMVFTADRTAPRLAVINTAADKLQQWIALPSRGYGTAVTADGRWVLVAMPDVNEIAVVDLRRMKLARSIPVCAAPQEIVLPPGAAPVAYVSCESARSIGVVDLTRWSMIRTIAVGQKPDGLAWVGALPARPAP